jgi:hypothetical protein
MKTDKKPRVNNSFEKLSGLFYILINQKVGFAA